MLLKQDDIIQDILSSMYLSTRVFATTIFPNLFSSSFSPLHTQIFDLLDSGARKIAIAAPRGIGKTTIARTVAAKGILWRDINFISYVSNSATVAEMQTENLKHELLSNVYVKELFGDITITDTEGPKKAEESFSKKAWTAFGSTYVLPRGAGQQIRGLNWRGYRPQLIIVDDLESSEEVQNEVNRQKLKTWFFSDVMKSVDFYLDNWKIIYIDTMKHEDSLLMDLVQSSDWESCVLSICDENYNSYAPEYMTTEEIKREVERHREAGLLDLFYREFMNIPISTEDAVFKQTYFKYYEEHEEKLDQNKLVENVVIVDPAKTVKLHSAESAIVGIGINRSDGRIFIRDLVAKKLHPDELYAEAINMCIRLRARVLAIEVTSLNEFITYPIKNELSARNVNIELVELSARNKKEFRIAALAPFYRKGSIYHNPSVCGPIEAQLLSFPRCKRFDAIDAAAYVVELLEHGERYFYSDSDDEPSGLDVFADMDEPAFEGWRVI